MSKNRFMKGLRVSIAAASVSLGGGALSVATDVGTASASHSCNHRAASGNVNVRASRTPSSSSLQLLIAPNGNRNGDCGATGTSPANDYSCFGLNGFRWYNVYPGYLASACVSTTHNP